MDNIPINIQLYKSYQIILEMLQLRGFSTAGYTVPSREEINEMKNRSFCEPIIVTHERDREMNTEVHFMVFQNTKNRNLEKFLMERYENLKFQILESINATSEVPVETEEGADPQLTPAQEDEMRRLKTKQTIIIITKDAPSDNVKNIADEFYMKNGIYVQIFYIKMLMFNVTRHEYVPQHIVLSEKEFEEVRTHYSIKNKSQFPIISHHEPVAMFIGLRPGQLCKIIRSSETSGRHITYRYCK